MYRPSSSRTGRTPENGGGTTGTACGSWWAASSSQSSSAVPCISPSCPRAALSSSSAGSPAAAPSTTEVTSVDPSGARDGSAAEAAIVWATGPRPPVSTISVAPEGNAAGAAWCSTVTGLKSGTRRPGSSRAASAAPVATTTARHRNAPCRSVVTTVVATDTTRAPVRTEPAGSPAASSRGSASAPPAGRLSPRRANARSVRSPRRLDVASSGSWSSADSRGRSELSAMWGGMPRALSAPAAVSSGLARSRASGQRPSRARWARSQIRSNAGASTCGPGA